MKTIHLVIVSFFLFLFSFSKAQQSYFYVTGVVTQSDTKEPLQGASVFAENTTFGTTTDATGHFALALPNGGYEIIVSFTGLSTQSRRISVLENNPLAFELSPKEKMMQEVAVVSTGEVKNGWEKYGKVFLSEFIGQSPNSSSCTIKNPEVLKFYYSKRKSRLKVMSDETLVIENENLGYRIKYQLDSFVHEYNTDMTVYTGYPLFEEITSADDLQQQRRKEARKKTYNGSVLHFMRSLYDMQLAEEGFEIQFIVKVNGQDTAIKLRDFYGALHFDAADSVSPVSILPNQLVMGIIYKKEKPDIDYLKVNKNEPAAFQFSTINFKPGNQLIIEQNGYYYEQNDITISGYWSWTKMADALPYDYEPE